MTSSADHTPSPETALTVVARRSRRWFGLLLFVAGVVVGVVAVGLLNTTTPDFAESATQPSADPGDERAPAPPGGVPVAARAEVNASCLRVINQAQDVYGILLELDQAVTDVNLQQLDDMVRRLQPIQPRLAEDLQGCRVDTEAVGPSPSAPPSAEASASQAQPSPTR